MKQSRTTGKQKNKETKKNKQMKKSLSPKNWKKKQQGKP